MGNYIEVNEDDNKSIVYLKAECGKNISASIVNNKEELEVAIKTFGEDLQVIYKDSTGVGVEYNNSIENPLILVFYIDRETLSDSNFSPFFVEAVNDYIAQKKANMMAFFLPTDGEERVECINPVLLAKPDMDKVNKLVNDIANKFDTPTENYEESDRD